MIRRDVLTAKLIYSAIALLDGYIEDEDGLFDWAVPSEAVHAFINDLEGSVERDFNPGSRAECPSRSRRWEVRGASWLAER